MCIIPEGTNIVPLLYCSCKDNNVWDSGSELQIIRINCTPTEMHFVIPLVMCYSTTRVNYTYMLYNNDTL